MTRGKEGFVNLHVHTEYSLFESLVGIDELIESVKEQGATTCAITDTGNMFGAIEFYEKAKKMEIKPIIGAEIKVRALAHNSSGGSMIFLAKNSEGYQNLMQIVTAGSIERGQNQEPSIGQDLLKKHSAGLIALSGGINGEIGKLLLEERDEEAWDIVLEYSRIFGKENFYLELQATDIDRQDELNSLNVKVSHHLDVPLVITCPVRYIKKEDQCAYESLWNASNTGNQRAGTYLKTEEELKKKYWWVPEGITNTSKIAAMCDLELDIN